MKDIKSEIEVFLESATISEKSRVATVRVRQFDYDQWGFTAGYDVVADDPDYFLRELWWYLSIKPGLLFTEEGQYLSEDEEYRKQLKGKFRYFVDTAKFQGKVFRFACAARLKRRGNPELTTVYGQAFVTVS